MDTPSCLWLRQSVQYVPHVFLVSFFWFVRSVCLCQVMVCHMYDTYTCFFLSMEKAYGFRPILRSTCKTYATAVARSSCSLNHAEKNLAGLAQLFVVFSCQIARPWLMDLVHDECVPTKVEVKIVIDKNNVTDKTSTFHACTSSDSPGLLRGLFRDAPLRCRPETARGRTGRGSTFRAIPGGPAGSKHGAS